MQTVGSKQEWEAFRQPFDFTNYLGDDETINAITEVVIESLDDNDAVVEDVTDSMANDSNNTISSDAKTASVWVEGGTDGTRYKITCRITGTLSSKYELECIMPVREI